jgi:hypothetical protein
MASNHRQSGAFMNIKRFKEDDLLQVPFLDIIAWRKHTSPSSICFNLGTIDGNLHTIIGNAEVHHPCDGKIKTVIRIELPEKYQKPDPGRRILAMVRTLCEALEISVEDTYEANVRFGGTGYVCINDPDLL